MSKVDRNLVAEIKAEVSANQSALLELCASMVSAESVNPPGRTSGMANVLSTYLAANELPAEIVTADEEAPNVICRLNAERPGPHVVFNAHMDTMLPGDTSAWSVPVLSLHKADDRLYGLGMGNMKGALAAMALAMKIVAKRLPRLQGALSLTAVSDEVMFGTRGTPFLLDKYPELYGDYMISGEGPGWMSCAVAEKGLLWLDITAQGEAGHSSRARVANSAPARLAKFILKLDELNSAQVSLPMEIAGIEGGPDNVGFGLSANVGSIEAGSVRSLMAPVARAGADLRLPPGISIEKLKDSLEELASECEGISLKFVKGWGANWTSIDHPLIDCLSSGAEAIRGQATKFVVRLPGSDARYWRDRGIPAVCYGPQPTLSAGVDDYVVEQDLLDCAAIYALSAIRLLTPSDAR